MFIQYCMFQQILNNLSTSLPTLHLPGFRKFPRQLLKSPHAFFLRAALLGCFQEHNFPYKQGRQPHVPCLHCCKGRVLLSMRVWGSFLVMSPLNLTDGEPLSISNLAADTDGSTGALKQGEVYMRGSLEIIPIS